MRYKHITSKSFPILISSIAIDRRTTNLTQTGSCQQSPYRASHEGICCSGVGVEENIVVQLLRIVCRSETMIMKAWLVSFNTVELHEGNELGELALLRKGTQL